MSSTKIVIATKKLSKSSIIFTNTTSMHDCIEYKNINFIFADEGEITLSIPSKKCTTGHHLSLYIFDNDKQLRKLSKMPKDKSVLKCKVVNGTVQSIEEISPETSEITLKITDKVNEFWDGFVEEIESKQEKISEIFQRYRS